MARPIMVSRTEVEFVVDALEQHGGQQELEFAAFLRGEFGMSPRDVRKTSASHADKIPTNIARLEDGPLHGELLVLDDPGHTGASKWVDGKLHLYRKHPDSGAWLYWKTEARP